MAYNPHTQSATSNRNTSQAVTHTARPSIDEAVINEASINEASASKTSIDKILFSKTSIYQYFIAPPEHVFFRFRLGAVIFFIGLVVIYSGHELLSPSLLQEVITLVGLLLIGGGFLFSLFAQIRMLIGRLLRFFRQ